MYLVKVIVQPYLIEVHKMRFIGWLPLLFLLFQNWTLNFIKVFIFIIYLYYTVYFLFYTVIYDYLYMYMYTFFWWKIHLKSFLPYLLTCICQTFSVIIL